MGRTQESLPDYTGTIQTLGMDSDSTTQYLSSSVSKPQLGVETTPASPSTLSPCLSHTQKNGSYHPVGQGLSKHCPCQEVGSHCHLMRPSQGCQGLRTMASPDPPTLIPHLPLLLLTSFPTPCSAPFCYPSAWRHLVERMGSTGDWLSFCFLFLIIYFMFCVPWCFSACMDVHYIHAWCL